MSFKIQDNTGKSYGLKINENNRAAVCSSMTTEEHIITTEGCGFLIHSATTDDTLTVPECETNFTYIKNEADKIMVIQKILISSDSNNTIIKIYKNPTITTFTNSNVFEPVNANFGSSRAASTDVRTWDETGTGIGGISSRGELAEIYTTRLGPNSIDLNGGIVIPQGQSMLITATSTTSSDEVVCITKFYFKSL